MRQTKAQRLTAEIASLYEQLVAHQDRCKHPDRHLSHVLRGNSGYDGDTYWTNFKCSLCKKRWAVDGQDRPRGTRVDSLDIVL